MKGIEIRTVESKSMQIKYKQNLASVITFLRHDEDKIIVRNGETVNIDIYDNGKLLFSGDKSELFKKLKGGQNG